MGLPDFLFKDIDDVYVRENFKKLSTFVKNFPLFRGNWVFSEETFTTAVTNLNVAHGLGFRPTDIIQTSKTGAGNITFNYSSFTETHISVTTTGACVVRFFIGAYSE